MDLVALLIWVVILAFAGIMAKSLHTIYHGGFRRQVVKHQKTNKADTTYGLPSKKN